MNAIDSPLIKDFVPRPPITRAIELDTAPDALAAARALLERTHRRLLTDGELLYLRGGVPDMLGIARGEILAVTLKSTEPTLYAVEVYPSWDDLRKTYTDLITPTIELDTTADPALAYSDDGPYAPVLAVAGSSGEPEAFVPFSEPEAGMPLIATPEPEPKPAPEAKKRKAPGSRVTPESAAINATIRAELKKGASVAQAARAAGITTGAAQQRIVVHHLRDGKPKPAKKAKKIQPLPNPKPKPLTKPTVKPVNDTVSPLGSCRRIRALYAIGYDPDSLGSRLNASPILLEVLADTEYDGEVPVELAHRIDDLYKRLRYAPKAEHPGWTRLDRSGPPPGAWSDLDIDNPDHHARVKS